jgi:signal transduction histidine kinase
MLARIRNAWGTVRVRTTAAAIIVVGAALVVASVAMVASLRRSLTDDVRTSALLRADVVEEELQGNVSSGVIAGGDVEEEYVQVVDSSGRVVASSENVAGRPPFVDLRPGGSRQIDGLPFESGPFLAAASGVDSPQGRVTIVVGKSLEDVMDSSRAVIRLLGVGVPLLMLIVGVVTWRVVGQALAPVEAIRSEVEAISSKELHRRVPDPPGKDEIAHLAATMNQMLARLEKGQQRQRQFVSDASHELRSPVASIRQHAEVALSHTDAIDVGEFAGIVLEEDLRLQRLVEDLLLLTRADEGTLRGRTEPVDLDDLVFEEAARLRSNGEVTVDTRGVSAGRVLGDRGQLGKLIRNLTDNAVRHARHQVAMSLRNGRGEIVLTVDDDGDGIATGERERVFQRFVRLQDARDRDSGGSGLGLAIVAEITAAHGGEVSVEDSPMGGARFDVRFPAA